MASASDPTRICLWPTIDFIVTMIGLRCPMPRRRAAIGTGPAWRSVVKARATGAATVAAALPWPSALFGQTSQVVEYYDTDAIGSVRTVTDAQGQVVARHDFLPFGEELNPQTPPHDKKLYTGQERDFERGQDYFGTRQLRTDVGRFLAPDPIILVPRVVGSQGLNSYTYVRNNPLRLIDPNGLDPRGAESPQEISPDWSPTDLPPGVAVDLVGGAITQEEAQRAAQQQYDYGRYGPEDPTNPGHPLSRNPIVKAASDEAFMLTANGEAVSGTAEAGFAIEYKDGKIYIDHKVNSVHDPYPANKLRIDTDLYTIAILHTHGNRRTRGPQRVIEVSRSLSRTMCGRETRCTWCSRTQEVPRTG